MKYNSFIKIVLLFLVATITYSCSRTNDDTVETIDFIGEWQRSDATENFEYSLTFIIDQTGYNTELERHSDGTMSSIAKSFEWTLNDDVLTIDFEDEIVTTHFHMDNNSRLHLDDITDLYFIKNRVINKHP